MACRGITSNTDLANMPEAQAAVGGGRQQSWEDKAWSIGKNVLMFVAFQYAIKQFMGGSKPATPAVPDASAPASNAVVTDAHLVYPMWPSNVSVDVEMFLTTSFAMAPFDTMPEFSHVVSEKNFQLDRSKKDGREIHTSFDTPPSVIDNGTLWAQIFVGLSGAELDPASPRYDVTKAYRMIRPLTQYLPKKKVKKTRSLLGNKEDAEATFEEVIDDGLQVASYYHPNFTLSFVPDTGTPQLSSLHPATRQFYPLFPPEYTKYYPVLYHNTFWQLRSQMIELNSTLPTKKLDLNVHLSTLSNWQFGIMASMDEGMKETARKAAAGQSTPGGGDGSELELIKETLLDTNPWLLGTTAFVSVLHMIFELLAFKSDVGHWRKKKDNVGVSVRTILSNVVMQTIIFLYLMDNNESTSWMILFGQGMGIAIEAWKITKMVDVRLRTPAVGSRLHGVLPYVVVFEDKHQLSETEKETEEYDKIAFK